MIQDDRVRNSKSMQPQREIFFINFEQYIDGFIIHSYTSIIFGAAHIMDHIRLHKEFLNCAPQWPQQYGT